MTDSVPFESIRPMPRLGRGIRWSDDIVTEIEADEAAEIDESSSNPDEAA